MLIVAVYISFDVSLRLDEHKAICIANVTTTIRCRLDLIFKMIKSDKVITHVNIRLKIHKITSSDNATSMHFLITSFSLDTWQNPNAIFVGYHNIICLNKYNCSCPSETSCCVFIPLTCKTNYENVSWYILVLNGVFSFLYVEQTFVIFPVAQKIQCTYNE